MDIVKSLPSSEHLERQGSFENVERLRSADPTADIVDFKEAHVLDSVEETQPGRFIWLCVAATAIGGALFGYDTGVISGVLVVIGSDLDHRPLSDSDKELITTLCAAGAFCGAIVAGISADKFGRRPAIWFASILFTIGAIIQATAYTMAQMCVGRVMIGLGVGSASMIVPLYIAELSPARYRGRMISVDMIFLATGSVLAYAMDAAFQHVAHGWRYMVGLGAVPSILLGVLLFWCPESPRQLLYRNKREEAMHVLRRIYPHATDRQIEDKILSIRGGIYQDTDSEMSIQRSLKSLFCIPSNRRAGITACGLMFFQQFCGFNTLMYYSSTLFDIVGFSNPVAVGTVVAGVNWIFTVFSIFWIDRAGRRRILLWTMWIMPVCLIVAAIAFKWIPLDRHTLKLTSDTIGWPAYVVLVTMILFVAFYAASLGCVPWQANEFLPMEVRAVGTMLMTTSVWGPNIVVSATFLSMMEGITPSGTFGFYAALCFLGWVFVYFCFPEASGMNLEEIRAVFENGFGIKYAEDWHKKQKAAAKARRDMIQD